MTGPESLRVDGRLGKWEQCAGRDDRLVSDHDRAVVERAAGHEDRRQQVGGEVAVDHDAGLGDLLETRFALDHDERAVALRGQDGRGTRDFARDALGHPLGRR